MTSTQASTTEEQRDRGEAMPFYQFTVPAGSATARKKAEVAAAVTAAHAELTGAPPEYVNCSFTEVPPGSIFAGGSAVEHGRMVGIIRQGRSEEVKRTLMTALADAWISVTGEPADGIALFVHEVPGYQVMEYGQLLPEAADNQR
jgi:phenylpyruvate tautomerase PptA (4-oxalocrotonate tautomerase family)